MSNWMGFDADYMRNNPELERIIRGIEVPHLKNFYKGEWKPLETATKLISNHLTSKDPIKGGVLAESLED